MALSKPQPITVEKAQSFLAHDEALIVIDFDIKSYAWVITRSNADWVELTIGVKELSEQVNRLRSSLTFAIDKPFDTQLAYNLYQATGPQCQGACSVRSRRSQPGSPAACFEPSIVVNALPATKSVSSSAHTA
jgi:hypothetical protein